MLYLWLICQFIITCAQARRTHGMQAVCVQLGHKKWHLSRPWVLSARLQQPYLSYPLFSLFAGHVRVMSRLSHRQQKVSDYTQAPPHLRHEHPSFTQPRVTCDLPIQGTCHIGWCTSHQRPGVHLKHVKPINGIQHPLNNEMLWNWHRYPGIATLALLPWHYYPDACLSSLLPAQHIPRFRSKFASFSTKTYNSGRELLHLHCQTVTVSSMNLKAQAWFWEPDTKLSLPLATLQLIWNGSRFPCIQGSAAARSLLDERRTCSSQNQSV